MIKRLPWVQIGLTATLSALGSLAFAGAFDVEDLLTPVLAAVCGANVVAILVRARPRPHIAGSVVASVVGFFAFVVLILFRSTNAAGVVPTSETFESIRSGIVDGWAYILSTSVPAPDREELLFVPVFVAWLSSAISIEVLLRTRLVLVPLAPSIVAGCVGILFGLDASGTWFLGSMVFVAVAVALAIVRSDALADEAIPHDARPDRLNEHPGVGGRSLVTVSVLVLFLAVVSALVARALPFVDSTDAVELRDYYLTPVDEIDNVNPLAKVGSGDEADPLAFTVTIDRDPHGDARFRLLVLDEYDGTRWTSSGESVTTGSQLPRDEQRSAGVVQTVRQQVAIDQLDGNWLPMIDRPIEIEVPTETEIQVDPLTGVLVLPDVTRLDGLTYEGVSEVVEYEATALVNAGVGTGPDARAAVDTTLQLPEDVDALNDRIMATAGSPFQQLANLSNYFKGAAPELDGGPRLEVDHSPAGYTLTHLADFLNPGKERKGPPEQFASAFAILARDRGFPARLAVGYMPASIEPGVPTEVHQSDLTAWAEVKLEGVGWVPFDPAPREEDEVDQITPQEQELDAAIDTASQQSAGGVGQSAAENPNLVEPSNPDATRRVLAVTGVVLLVLVVALLVVLGPLWLKRRRRRRRRNADDATERIVGAWNEAIDRLVEIGMQQAPTLTVPEVVAEADERIGAEAGSAARMLGQIVNGALYDRPQPAEADATVAWRLSDEFMDDVHTSLSRKERVRAALSRRPLLASNRRS